MDRKLDTKPFEFLTQLLETPSPSGFEHRIQDVVRDYVADFADSVETDCHGNVIVGRNTEPDESKLKVMLAGHCDQIGMIVSHVSDDGFIHAQPIGGWDPLQLIGQRMLIWPQRSPDSGPVEAVPAVISRKASHLLTDKERGSGVKIEDLWLDIGVHSRDEALELLEIGDPVTLTLGMQAMQGDRINGPGMDDRTGVWVVLEALRRAGPKLHCAAYAVSTVAEEIGLRGATTSTHRIDPDVGIAVDVTHATDCPTIDKRMLGDIRLTKGPVIFHGPNMNRHVVSRLKNVATRARLPYQPSALGRAAPNDSNAIQISRSGVATGLVSIPNRYMHSAVETVSLQDLDVAADLLAEFFNAIRVGDDFTP